MIDKNAVGDYLPFLNEKELNLAKYKIVEFKETNKERIRKIENAVLTDEKISKQPPILGQKFKEV